MDQLDLLKKDWKKQDVSFPKFSQSELSKLIHKKSSSIVKWIFIISILELVIPHIIYLLTGYLDYSVEGYKDLGLSNFLIASSLILYSGVIYFIYKFYKNYKNISASSSSKKLMNDIIDTRKIVKQYIWFNIIGFFITSIVMLSKIFSSEDFIAKIEDTNMTLIWVIAILILAFIILIVWLFYQLLYGILLNKLKNNYDELAKGENGDL